ncbi:unnamed protein product [Ilex paraguariensis]|uniref:Pectinesterase n=1 Tax=Ilex paraguariensis TaxID=185542 RepID=A0ABC8RSQ6_9AQUA
MCRCSSCQLKKIMCPIIILTLVWLVQGKLGSEFHITVALDGSGDFNTISHAVNAAPNYSKERYYIRIKAGTYVENVVVGKKKTNISFIGDGMGMTIITGNKSVGKDLVTFETATLDINGDGFMAKHITFRNDAGPTNGQAVAMKCSATFSSFFQCRFEGYQDTLYVHRGIQFYKECEILGTTDIIFVDAKVVFQNCGIYVRNPEEGHLNVITAQGRERPEDDGGISIHPRTIAAAKGFNPNPGTKTYLGRPWRPFSTVVIMQSFLDYIIDPEGWLKWDNNTSTLSSLYYGEYQNYGPGANTANRITWKGYHKAMSLAEAENFAVRNFIKDQAWLGPTSIPYAIDLAWLPPTNIPYTPNRSNVHKTMSPNIPIWYSFIVIYIFNIHM